MGNSSKKTSNKDSTAEQKLEEDEVSKTSSTSRERRRSSSEQSEPLPEEDVITSLETSSIAARAARAAIVAIVAISIAIHLKFIDQSAIHFHDNELMQSIQMGLQYVIARQDNKPEKVVIIQNFYESDTTIFFPANGSQETPAHSFTTFEFQVHSPDGLRHFRSLYDINIADYLISLCHEPMVELSNPGASGSIFYLSKDEKYLFKEVSQIETVFLKQLLPNYYIYIKQKPRTLLPKFSGLYKYQCNTKNISFRIVVMHNVFPTDFEIHQKYDLKGSTYKRKASDQEKAKKHPTLKDLDFMNKHPEGLTIDSKRCNELMSQIRSDCRILESHKIMDYSLLLGIHVVGKACETDPTKWEMETTQVPEGSIPGYTSAGDRILIFLAIIDILISYRTKKKLEHTFKSLITDGDTVSVHNPKFYRERFIKFMETRVFKGSTRNVDEQIVLGQERGVVI